MEKLIYSKYLQAQATEQKDLYTITNERTGKGIIGSIDLIHFIESFHEPKEAREVVEAHQLENGDELVAKLKEIRFLNEENEDEEKEIFDKWRAMFYKQIDCFKDSDRGIEIIYSFSDTDPVEVFLKELSKIFFELSNEFFPWKRPIYVCFLSKKEFHEASIRFKFPAKIRGFVDGRSTLVLNYELFMQQENSMLFYPTIRHEGLHILFGQYRLNLPFWLEEGLCELYSLRTKTEDINTFLKNKELISFSELNHENIYNIYDYELSQEIKNTFYIQSQSFTQFLIEHLSKEMFWKIINQKSIRLDSFQQALQASGKTVQEWETLWQGSIKGWKGDSPHQYSSALS